MSVEFRGDDKDKDFSIGGKEGKQRYFNSSAEL